jgi:hypothetical protein
MGLNMYGLSGAKSGVMTALGQMTRTSSPSVAGAGDAKLDKKFLKVTTISISGHCTPNSLMNLICNQ